MRNVIKAALIGIIVGSLVGMASGFAKAQTAGTFPPACKVCELVRKLWPANKRAEIYCDQCRERRKREGKKYGWALGKL